MNNPEKDTVLDEIRDAISIYWRAYFVGEDGQCSLCGNSGVINTRGRAINASGVDQGRIQFCLCFRGQELRSITNSNTEMAVINAVYPGCTDAEFKSRFHHVIAELHSVRAPELLKAGSEDFYRQAVNAMKEPLANAGWIYSSQLFHDSWTYHHKLMLFCQKVIEMDSQPGQWVAISIKLSWPKRSSSVGEKKWMVCNQKEFKRALPRILKKCGERREIWQRTLERDGRD